MATSDERSAAAGATSSSAQHEQEPAGAEFSRRRLQRAMAIPPEQRDPVVHAFVTSVQLMGAADELLPLTADGQPAPPADALVGQQAEVQAMLLAATADHTCAGFSEWEGGAQDRLGRYVRQHLASAENGGSWESADLPALQPLGGVLLSHMRGRHSHDPLHAVVAMAELEAERSTVSQQLGEAQRSCAHQLLTAAQLEAAMLFRHRR